MKQASGVFPVALLVAVSFLTMSSCAVPDSFIVVSELRRIRRLELNESASYTTDVSDPLVTTRAIAVDFDAKTESLYWTDYSKKAIMRSQLVNRTDSVVVFPGLATPDGLAVDWIGNHIYYTDAALRVIGVVSIDGYYALPLVQSQLDKPRAISLDPSNGMMYWTDWGASPKIERSYMSGDKREILVNSSLVYPNGLALDLSGDVMYWVDARLDTLERSRLDGSGRKVLVRYNTPSSSIHPFALTFFDAWLYWTDWRLKGVIRVSLESLDAKRIFSFADKPMGIAVYDANRISGSNGCSSNNGDCQQICLAEGTGRRCDCAYGTLNNDGKTCTVSDGFVLYADIDSVRAITFTANDDREASYPVMTTEIPYGVDYAWDTGTVFWTERESRRIMKASHDYERTQAVVVVDSQLTKPVSVAYDWMGGNLFFADMGKGSISVCRRDGSFRRNLIVTDLGEPTSLAVDPAGGYLYWTDQKAKFNRIERSFMSGDKREVIVASNVLGAPKGLTLDLIARKIYWVEHHADKIGVADLDGGNRATLVSNNPLLEQPIHLAHYSGYLYITSEVTNSVLRCGNDGSNLTLFQRTRDTPEGIKVVHPTMQRGQNACSRNNGGCRQLCLAVPGDRVCACKVDNTSSDCLPTVVSDTSSRQVLLGESVDIPCTVRDTGVPIARVTWLHDGVVVSTIHDVNADVSFHLDVVDLSDSGRYTCVVENEYGHVSSVPQQLTVLESMTATTSSGSENTASTLSTSIGHTSTANTSGSSDTSGVSLVVISGIAGGTLVLVVLLVVLGMVICRRYGRSRPRVLVVNPTYMTGSHGDQEAPPPYEECDDAKCTAITVETDSKAASNYL